MTQTKSVQIKKIIIITQTHTQTHIVSETEQCWRNCQERGLQTTHVYSGRVVSEVHFGVEYSNDLIKYVAPSFLETHC